MFVVWAMCVLMYTDCLRPKLSASVIGWAGSYEYQLTNHGQRTALVADTVHTAFTHKILCLIYFDDTSVLFSQLIAPRKWQPFCWYFHFHTFHDKAFFSSTLPSALGAFDSIKSQIDDHLIFCKKPSTWGKMWPPDTYAPSCQLSAFQVGAFISSPVASSIRLSNFASKLWSYIDHTLRTEIIFNITSINN